MPHKQTKRVKIVATIGPSTSSREMIASLALLGVNVFRINLSHATRESAAGIVSDIRSVEKKLDIPLAIMGDLMGPKIRIGIVEPNTILQVGRRIAIVSKSIMGSEEKISLNFPTILRNLKKGAEIYLGDGDVKLTVERQAADGIVAKVIVGGALRSRMGFSAHGMTLKKFALSAKDREDIKIMMELGADALAISFVQTSKDVLAVKKLVPKGRQPMLIAKIETLAGVENAESILDAADGLMVARGDLGFCVPMGELPHIQKRLIALCLKKAKPVITATQMLESMVHSHIPTRAEATDVANAILDGTDAVMLSQETAMGKYPLETVRMMAEIIRHAEAYVIERHFPEAELVADAISASVVRVANQIGARLIVVLSQKGVTARRISRHRCKQPIIALSPDEHAIRRLNFSWGVFGYRLAVTKDFDDLVSQTKKAAGNNDAVKLQKGDPFVVSAGIPFGQSGTTNMVLVERV